MNPANWDLALQVAAAIGIALAGILAFMRGSRDRSDRADPTNREIGRLREERQQDHDRQIVMDVRSVRADFEIVIRSLKENYSTRFDDICKQLEDIFNRLRELERDVAVLNDRQGRRR